MTSKTSENQSKAPLCAAFVKAMREFFGEVTVLSVSEGDVKLGEAARGYPTEEGE